MKRIITLCLVNLILVLLQLSFLASLFGGVLAPNLVLAFAAALVLANSKDTALLSALVGGIFIDLLGVSYFGISAFLFVLFVQTLYLSRKYVYKNVSFQVLLVSIFVLVYKLVLNLPRPELSPLVLFSVAGTLLAWVLFYAVIRSFRQD